MREQPLGGAALGSPANQSQQAPQKRNAFTIAGLPPTAIAFLLLTALISLLWSHTRLLFRDEFYEMWTDRVPGIGQLIHIQHTYPVSLDPLTYHLLAHACIQVFGANSFALRLTALLGVLLMQACIFLFIRNIATERAAIFAMGLPALTCVLGYAAEGRPYGLMLGLFGLTMVCWQSAARREADRSLVLIILAISLALALNAQYFGVLLFAPLCLAELFRTFQRRRIDLPMLVSFAVGFAGIALVVPFMRAAKAFHNSYGASTLSLRSVAWPYVWTLANHPSSKMDYATFAIVGVVVCVSLLAYARRLRGKAISSLKPDEVFLLALAALPFWGLAAALATRTPTLEPRFVVSVVIGICGLTALGLFSILRSDRAGKQILWVLFAAIALTGSVRIWSEHKMARDMVAAMRMEPQVRAALMASPSRTLYVQEMECFGNLTFNDPDPEIHSHLALLYSKNQETKWDQESVIALTALHLHQFAQVSIAPYESVTTQPGKHIIVDFSEPAIRLGAKRGWNWVGLALAADNADVQIVGNGFRSTYDVPGDVLSVDFPEQHNVQSSLAGGLH